MAISDLRSRLQEGLVIPAHPLALNADRKLDARHQRALTRYYLASGAGGLAVGVHTTQFEIHQPSVGLYAPVLELALEGAQRFARAGGRRPIMVAGLVGDTSQAVREATLARSLEYDAGLLSLGALRDASDHDLIEHARAVAEVLPLFGFYLQPAVGGRILSFEFWRRLAEIENLVAIKIAPFNRYQTIDVVRAIAESGRSQDVALYTGNDDNILLDLLTEYRFTVGGRPCSLRIRGGLLGQWAVWTKRAVEWLAEIRQGTGDAIPAEWLRRNIELTDANAALFDVAHQFAGCIAGIHEVLRRQGLMPYRGCLNPQEDLSPGQMEAIDRVHAAYPHLNDDDFVRRHLDEWLE